MVPRLLAWVLAQAVGMAIAHLLMARKKPFPAVWFCGLSGALMAVSGLALMGVLLIEHARLSAWTWAWIPAFALGTFAAGLVLGVAWLGLVLGGGWWLRRRLSR